MALTCKHEEISHATAQKYLGQSAGNRRINNGYVLALAAAMETNKWDPDASEIVFDDSGELVDGHHRLHAVMRSGKTVRMLVKRGVNKAARGFIDTGRTRNIRDLFAMFRPELGYVNNRKSALTVCIGLVTGGSGRPPVVRTLSDYDTWMKQFEEGIDMALRIVGPKDGSHRAFCTGPVLGGFAFAHKSHPKKVEAFLVKSFEGLGLKRGEPATTLRNLLINGGPSISAGGSTERQRVSKKVLSAIHADLKGLPWSKAQAGQDGHDYFRKAYDGRAIARLVELWSDEPAPGLKVVQ